MYINGQKWVFLELLKILTFEYYAKNKTYSVVNFAQFVNMAISIGSGITGRNDCTKQ